MTSSVQLHPRKPEAKATSQSPLPQLIQTPSGLAILELQGTINLPQAGENSEHNTPEVDVGRIVFPDYHPDTQDPSSTSWMKQVYLYVGEHQRLTGEVKKLPKAMAIIKKRAKSGDDIDMADDHSESTTEDLEVVEIVKHKLVFSQRPEPVGTKPAH
ncbi:chromosome transmission fidelity protein 8 [Hypoxylon rubiginosum]|uniref:Chromosome transmission fidelity protein 8 n=1 Tax=Hypoxylon rubiginosum TaxID=110542 RepID=A0ACB9ZE94_9PEZI|nr:chromosome transmission fidelity protein 8 [Hypoxylon rubiginosum]